VGLGEFAVKVSPWRHGQPMYIYPEQYLKNLWENFKKGFGA
jgi:hypothetical protein